MAEPLSADALVEQAHKNTGVDAFDCESYREGLEVFVRDFNKGIKKGLYLDTGIERVRADCLHYLSNRLKVWDYLQHNPELLKRPKLPLPPRTPSCAGESKSNHRMTPGADRRAMKSASASRLPGAGAGAAATATAAADARSNPSMRLSRTPTPRDRR